MGVELRSRGVPARGECGGCVYAAAGVMGADSDGVEGPTPVLECRRFPPVPVNDETGGLVMLWAQVLPDDWCGEWAPAAPD